MLKDSRAFDRLTSFHLIFFFKVEHIYIELSHLWVNNEIDNNKAIVVAKSTFKLCTLMSLVISSIFVALNIK